MGLVLLYEDTTRIIRQKGHYINIVKSLLCYDMHRTGEPCTQTLTSFCHNYLQTTPPTEEDLEVIKFRRVRLHFIRDDKARLATSVQ